MANSKFTGAKAMWQLGRVTKPDYQHFCNQIHLHQQLVNKGRIEPEAFQTAIGTLMEPLTKLPPEVKSALAQNSEQTQRGGNNTIHPEDTQQENQDQECAEATE